MITSADFQPIEPDVRWAFTHDDPYEALIEMLRTLDRHKVTVGDNALHEHYALPCQVWHATIAPVLWGCDPRLRNDVLEGLGRKQNTGGTTPRG